MKGWIRMSDSDFVEYVSARWPRLVRSAVLLGCSVAEAEDLVQSSLERCFVHWAKVCSADNRDAYVHRVLINTFRSERRRRWNGEVPTGVVPELGVASDVDRVDDAEIMIGALRRLTPDQRAVVVLRYYAHLSEAQTAEALRVPIGTAKSRLSRALGTLSRDPSLSEIRGRP